MTVTAQTSYSFYVIICLMLAIVCPSQPMPLSGHLSPFFFFFFGFCLFESVSCCVAQSGLAFVIFQPPYPLCWDYRRVPSCLGPVSFLLCGEARSELWEKGSLSVPVLESWTCSFSCHFFSLLCYSHSPAPICLCLPEIS